MSEPQNTRKSVTDINTASGNSVLQPFCPSCGRPENIIWVHGHGQCAHCFMNVMPCCDGETCEFE